MNNLLNHTLCTAPMMDWTDRHCRYFFRLLSPHAIVYTEMVTVGAIIHGDHQRFLHFHEKEHPIALQLGGSDPEALARCCQAAEIFGYDEINLNVGCPSPRVKNGMFGACLMAYPDLVAQCVAAMKKATSIPITVKTRIGIDLQDSYEELTHFIHTVANAGCDLFIIHARKAWLEGLSPKENREIPPLRYEVVKQLKQDFPHLTIILNGGIVSAGEALQHLTYADGLMLGRAAYHNPYILAELDHLLFKTERLPSRHEIINNMLPYIQDQLSQGVPLHAMTRHILGLFNGLPGARAWRRHLSEKSHQPNATTLIVEEALNQVSE